LKKINEKLEKIAETIKMPLDKTFTKSFDSLADFEKMLDTVESKRFGESNYREEINLSSSTGISEQIEKLSPL